MPRSTACSPRGPEREARPARCRGPRAGQEGLYEGRRVTKIIDEGARRAAIETALSQLVAGDLLVIQCDEGSPEGTVEQVHQWVGRAAAAPDGSARKITEILWKSPVSGPCAARISGAATRHRGHRGLLGHARTCWPTCPASKTACARASRPSARSALTTRPVRRRWPTRWKPPHWPAGLRRLPGHLQQHRAHRGARHVSGSGAVQRGGSRPARLRTR